MTIKLTLKGYPENNKIRIIKNVEYLIAEEQVIIKYTSRLRTVCCQRYDLDEIEKIEFLESTIIPSEEVAREENK